MNNPEPLPYYFIADLEINKSKKIDDQKRGEIAFESIKNFIEAFLVRLDFRTDIYILKKVEDRYEPIKFLNREDLAFLLDFYVTATLRNLVLETLEDFFDQHELKDFIIGDENRTLLSFGLNNGEHWDYNFIKMSEYYDDAFTIIGYSDQQESIVSQKYSRGKISKGILKTQSASYIGEKAYEKLNINEAVFTDEFYR
jgi:hypothetical protein